MSKNGHTILTELMYGTGLFFCAESGCCMRQCCGPDRGFVMHITNNFDQVRTGSAFQVYF